VSATESGKEYRGRTPKIKRLAALVMKIIAENMIARLDIPVSAFASCYPNLTSQQRTAAKNCVIRQNRIKTARLAC
jgi:hypothetical protein